MSRPGMLARLAQRAADLWHVPAAWSTVHRANVTDYTRDGRTIRTTGWEQHPVVMACTRAVVDLVQSVPLEVYRTDRDGERTVLEGHPLEALLQNPNPTAPQMPGARFMGLTALHFLLYGNAFWHIRRNGQANRGRPAGLKLVHPEYVRSAEFSEAEDRIIWYDWTQPETGTLRRSDVNDIVHFADLAGESWLFGYPRAAAALGDIAADNEATRYVRQIVTNDGGATQIFHMQDGATREQAEGAEARWREKRIHRGERGMAVFMPGTVKSETIGFNLQQLEFPDLRRVTREDICAVFGVDPRVIGVASAGSDGGLSGVQYREARRRLIAQAVSPLMFMLEAHVNHWLAPEYGEVQVRFSPNGLAELTEDEMETSSRAITEYQAGLRTLEEARALVALPEQRDPTHHVKAGLMGELTVADVGTLALPSAQAALAPPEAPEDAPAAPVRGALPPARREYDPNQPRDPSGTDTGGQWTSTAISPSERKIMGQKIETLLAFREPGEEPYFNKDGNENSVVFNEEEIAEARVLTHNHPTGSAFSEMDIVTSYKNAATGRLDIVRVVTPNGVIYEASGFQSQFQDVAADRREAFARRKALDFQKTFADLRVTKYEPQWNALREASIVGPKSGDLSLPSMPDWRPIWEAHVQEAVTASGLKWRKIGR